MQVSLEKHVCACCSSTEFTTKKVNSKYYGNDAILYECTSCGHGQIQSSIPKSDKDFASYYADENQSKHIPNIIADENPFTPTNFRYISLLHLLQTFISVREDMNVLEIGPGFPSIFHTLSKAHPNLHFYAIEPNQTSQMRLKQCGVNVISDYFPVERRVMDEVAEKFDIVTIINSFYYFMNPRQATDDILEVLSPGGVALIDLINSEVIDEKYFLANPLTHVYTYNSLKKLLEGNPKGDLIFINRCSADNTPSLFKQRRSLSAGSKARELARRLSAKLGYIAHEEAFCHLVNGEDFKNCERIGEGGRLRAIVRRSVR